MFSLFYQNASISGVSQTCDQTDFMLEECFLVEWI